MKIEIDVVFEGERTKDFVVSADGKYADHLTFEEMVGLVIALAIPAERRCLSWMRTQAEWDAHRGHLMPMVDRVDDGKAAS